MLEDPLLELPELRSRLQAKLRREPALGVSVRTERLGLPPGSIEGQHELAQEPLAEGMFANQGLELANQLRAASHRELGVDPVLQGAQPALLESLRLDRGKRLVEEIRQGRAAPDRQRLAQRPRRCRRVAGASVADQGLEAV